MKRFIISITWVILTLLGLSELSLRYIDPDGLYGYLSAWETLKVMPSSHGYLFVPSTYHLRAWDVTIASDGFRHIDTVKSDCKVALIGDSVTFGWGVSDGAIWAQLIADNTDATILMRSQPSYNIDNIKAVYDELSALGDIDGYIYLMVANDAQNAVQAERFKEYDIERTAIEYRLLYLMRRTNLVTPIEDIPHFRDTHAQMTGDNLITIGVQSNAPFIQAVQDITPYWINPSIHTVSRADGHANAQGNGELYAQIAPVALPFIDKVCNN